MHYTKPKEKGREEMAKIENTVPAENQMKNSSELSFLGNENGV